MQFINQMKSKMKRSRIITLLLAFMVATPSLLRAQIVKGELFVGGNACQVDGDECYRYRKFGAHAGAGALIPVTNFMDVGLEVLFSQKGAYKGDSLNLHLGSYTGTYNLKLNYVEVPLMVYLTDKDRFSVGVGISYGRIVGIDEKSNGVSTNIGLGDGHLHWKQNDDELPDLGKVRNINELGDIVYGTGLHDSITIPQVVANSNTYRARDFGLCADFRVRLWEGIHAELRYQYSIVPIRTRLFYKDQNETLLKDDDKNVPPLQLQYNNTLTLRVVYIFNERRSRSNREMMGRN